MCLVWLWKGLTSHPKRLQKIKKIKKTSHTTFQNCSVLTIFLESHHSLPRQNRRDSRGPHHTTNPSVHTGQSWHRQTHCPDMTGSLHSMTAVPTTNWWMADVINLTSLEERCQRGDLKQVWQHHKIITANEKVWADFFNFHQSRYYLQGRCNKLITKMTECSRL